MAIGKSMKRIFFQSPENIDKAKELITDNYLFSCVPVHNRNSQFELAKKIGFDLG